MKILDPDNKIGEFLDKIPNNEDSDDIREWFNIPEPKTKIGKFFRNTSGLFGWNLGYCLTHPWEPIGEGLRRLHRAWQRAIKGWDYSQTWSIDYAYSQILGELITHFRQVNNGIPFSIIDQVDENYQFGNDINKDKEDEARKLWDDILEEMAEGFLYYNEHKYNFSDEEEIKNMINKLHRSLELFSKYFTDLWW